MKISNEDIQPYVDLGYDEEKSIRFFKAGINPITIKTQENKIIIPTNNINLSQPSRATLTFYAHYNKINFPKF